MKVLIKTTIQINRIFKSKKKAAINEFMKENECYCSTYILGEFKANMIDEFLTLYGIVRTENNLADVCEKAAEVFGSSRQKSRLLLLLSSLQRDYGDDYALIKEQLEKYPELLLHRFERGIELPLLNSTQCARGKAELDTEHMVWKGKGVRCSKDCDQCAITQFWMKNKELVYDLEKVEGIQDKMVNALRCFNQKREIPKGNACRSLGDCVIALESLELENGCVVTSNKADYEPICQRIGTQLTVIN